MLKGIETFVKVSIDFITASFTGGSCVIHSKAGINGVKLD